MGWDGLPNELQEHIASLLPEAADRAALCAVDRSTQAVVAPLLTLERLTDSASRVTNLAQLQSIVGCPGSDASSGAAPGTVSISTLGHSSRMQPLMKLARLVCFLNAEQQAPALEIIFDQTQALPEAYRSGLFVALSHVAAYLKDGCSRASYQGLFAAAQDVYRNGNMPAVEYAKFLCGATGSLASLLDGLNGTDSTHGEQSVLLQQFRDAVALLPRENRAWPLFNLCCQFESIPPELRRVVHEGALAQTHTIADSDKTPALAGLAYAVRYLTEADDRAWAFEQLFDVTVQLPPSRQAAPLKSLSIIAGTLAEPMRGDAYKQILDTVQPMHEESYRGLLQFLAQRLNRLPLAQRSSIFDHLVQLARLTRDSNERSTTLANLAFSLSDLAPRERAERFQTLAEAVMTLGERHRSTPHQALLARLPCLTLFERARIEGCI